MQPLILLDDIFQENHLNLLFLTSLVRKFEQWESGKGCLGMTMNESGGARACRSDELHPVQQARYDAESRTRAGEEHGSY